MSGTKPEALRSRGGGQINEGGVTVRKVNYDDDEHFNDWRNHG